MKIQEVKNIICIIFMFGFFAGIIYLNVFARACLVSVDIFNDYFMEQYSESALNTSLYICYIIRLRVFPLLILVLLSSARLGRIAGALVLLWTGFSSGLILTIAVFKLGIKGILLCVVGVLPHFICYITVFFMLIVYMFYYPNIRWNGTKTVCMILFMLLGIITEVYINPVLMDMFIELL